MSQILFNLKQSPLLIYESGTKTPKTSKVIQINSSLNFNVRLTFVLICGSLVQLNYIKYQISNIKRGIVNLSGDTFPHKQLHHKVSERLRVAILEGKFKPGEWLRQQQIAEELGVSQMPVREALKELATEGLLEHIPYRGVRVVKLSPDDVVDLYAHRSFLEGLGAKVATEKITDEELTELHQILDLMRENFSPAQLNEYRHLNRQFHQLVYTACRRTYLVRTLNQMWSIFPTMLWSNFPETAIHPLPVRDNIDIQEHEAVLSALEKRNGLEAQQLMTQHILNAGSHLTEALKTKSV